MPSKKWFTVTASFLLIFLLVTGYLAISAEYGTQDDPLITASYISDVLKPETERQITAVVNQKVADGVKQIDSKISTFDAELREKLATAGASYSDALSDENFLALLTQKVTAKLDTQASFQAQTFKVITVAKGKTLKGQVGCEILLRLGSATCAASSSPGLINLTTGSELLNGKALSANCLYMVTVSGNGFKTAANATLLVRGSYTIS